MATKASFTAEEWSRVLASPMVAGMAITAADPSGLWGIMKEGMAGGWALLHAKQDPNANTLVKAVAEDFASGDARSPARERIQMTFKGAQPGDLKRRAVEELRALAAIIQTKAPEDASAFKGWLREVAQKAAEAGNEGGFLGFGGVAVSEAEKTTLAEIAAALEKSA